MARRVITVHVSNRLTLRPLDRIPHSLVEQIRARLTFSNSAYSEAEKRGFSIWNIPREIRGYRVEGDALVTPRGFVRQVVEILKRAGVQYQVDAPWRALAPVDFTFRGALHDFQVEAVVGMEAGDFGSVADPTGRGRSPDRYPFRPS